MDPGKIDPTSPWLMPGHVRIVFKHAFWHIHSCSLPFPRKLHSFVEITTMHSYVKLLVLCLLAIFAAQASATHNDKIVVEEEVDWCKAKCSGDKECRANKA